MIYVLYVQVSCILHINPEKNHLLPFHLSNKNKQQQQKNNSKKKYQTESCSHWNIRVQSAVTQWNIFHYYYDLYLVEILYKSLPRYNILSIFSVNRTISRHRKQSWKNNIKRQKKIITAREHEQVG